MTTTTLLERPRERVIKLMPGGQSDFFFDEARYPGLFGGVGACKTFTGLHKVVSYALKYPGARIFVSEPRFSLIHRVIYPMLQQEFSELEGTHWTLNKGNWEVNFSNGSLLILSSALLMNPEMLSGMFLAGFWMDEIAKGDQEASFLNLQARLRQKNKQGEPYPYFGIVTGTPCGQNWVYRKWGLGHKGAYSPHHVRTADNPYLPSDYLQDLRDSYGQTPFAQQELEGKFVAFGGLIYLQFDVRNHVQEPPGQPYEEVVAGVDFGLTSPSVIAVYARAGTGRVYGLGEFYQRRCPIEDLLKVAMDLQAEHKITRFFCDPSGKEEIEQMRRLGLPVAPAPIKEVLIGIQLVSSLLNKQADGRYGIYYSPCMVNTIAEKQQYQWREMRPGSSDYKDEPVKENDHAMDAERYAVTGLGHFPEGRPKIASWSMA